ncbi:FecR family protein [Chitinophaga jiangningensis]|uniref:FecR family protein n=1 Tax=Chitinophaga jiangningensis TaxID=1419482 RepID=A0A1M7LQK7_9BACT|nr:FecR family protein [Chitinophaga jiangningensis]SHM80533.1 FecR family protein [Chitinophaga jiangningensis]
MPTDEHSLMDHAFEENIAQLLHRQLTGEVLSAAEQQELEAWKNKSVHNAALLQKINDEASIHQLLQTWHNIDRNRAQNKVRFLAMLQPPVVRQPRLRLLRSKIFRYAAAATLLIGIATFYWQQQHPNKPAVAFRETAPIAPGKEGAILTLADGSQMVLDSAGNGLVANQNGTRIMLQNGQLAYNAGGGTSGTIAFNTVSTPKGRQFKLILPDGTSVWLNAASAITYPTAFNGHERTITLQGEAYFEVATNDKAPFKVTAGEATTIEVLGTSFNVNAYTNENNIRTTLLSGAVRIKAYQQTVTLKPAQQAAVKPSTAQLVVHNAVNTDQVLAWKNGLFNFENASLDEVMRQLERWYDIEVVYEKGIPPTRFGGEINKQNTLQDVLQILEGSNVHFQLQGRKLIVMP